MEETERLSRVLGPLRRALLRRVREEADLPDLGDAQVELLRVLADGPLTPGQAAAHLHVAPSTVSNLVRAMEQHDLVRRARATGDLRGVVLDATPHALALLARYDAASRTVLDRALADLPAAQRTRVAGAVQALEDLTRRLQP